jgi:TRC40/GET3/ArsA family transport-energizing ATPase
VRFPAEDILDEIEGAVTVFEKQILLGGGIVVVTRSGHVVEAETERLKSDLQRRGVVVAATITDRTTSSAQTTFVAPHLTTTTGCAALREWAQRFNTADNDAHAQRNTTAKAGNAAAWITAGVTRLIWVAGKGGVGKSTCAAAIGSLLAESRTVCVVSTDPAGSLSELFGKTVTREPKELEPSLYARQIDANAEFEQLRTQYYESVERVFAALGLESAVQLDRRVIETLFDFAPPGIDEIIGLVEILEHARDYDVTVIDSAPTGHFLRLLQLPEIAQQWVHALLRLLLKYKGVGSLDALGRDLLAFAKRLRQLKLDLTAAETTAVYVVTLDEPLVTAETQRLHAALQRADVPIAAIIVNRYAGGMRSTFSSDPVIHAPDTGREVVGPPALRSFLTQWEIDGE